MIGSKPRRSGIISGAEDPGVQSVQEIYTYYKKFGYETEVMGASFRNVGEILELAGCDLLTISPELMGKLAESHEPVERKLTPEKAKQAEVRRIPTRRKNVSLALERRCDGDREDGGRNSQVRGGYREAGEIRRDEARVTFQSSGQVQLVAVPEPDT